MLFYSVKTMYIVVENGYYSEIIFYGLSKVPMPLNAFKL